MTRAFARCTAALALATLATACARSTVTLPQTPFAPPSAQKALAKLVIKVPPKRHRRGRYVSPATASLAYSIDGTAQAPVDITVDDPRCGIVAPISYLQCTVVLSMKPGTHVFSFTTKDASGNVLSADTTVDRTIVAGEANQISVTLGGVAATLAIYPPNLPQVTGSQAAGFSIYGKGALAFSIVPLDADRNPIVGPGAPQPVVAATPASMTMKTPSPSSPTTWTLASTYAPSDPSVAAASSLQVSATPVPDSGGTTVSATVPLALYVPWVYATSGLQPPAPAVAVTDEFGNAQTAAGGFTNVATASNAGPNGIAYDPHVNRLFIEDSVSPKVVVDDPTGHAITVSGTFEDTNSDTPSGIVFDPHDDLIYVAYQGANTVAAFDENGDEQTLSGSFPGLSGPVGIAYDPVDQTIFVANLLGGNVTGYDEEGNAKTFSGGFTDLSSPSGIAYDPLNGWIYVVDDATPIVTVYDTQGNLQTVGGSFSGLTDPIPIAYDPHQDWFYVGNCGASSPISVFSPSGAPKTVAGTFAAQVPGIAVVP